MTGPTQATLPRTYRYYDLLLGAFVTVLLCSVLIGAAKFVTVGGFTFGAGILFFPLSYVFGDVLTEVYGYARSRRVVWSGFAAMIFASVMSSVVLSMPPSESWQSKQAAFETVFGSTWRISLASMLAYASGEFANSYVLARMKVWSEGRMLWARTIGSTVVGEAVDSLLFYPLAFLDGTNTKEVLGVMGMNYALKVAWEVVLTPVTYRVVAFLKRAENEDWYDRDTDFTPFRL